MVKNTGNQRIGRSGSQGVLIGYAQVMKKIDSIFAERITNVQKLFNETGKEILVDFRGKQLAEVQTKKKTKSQDEETANANVAKAIAYAKAHSGSVKVDRGITWANHTFRAARGVNVTIDANEEEVALKLNHGIYYGAYLEYAHNRKYAVLEPLIRQYAPKLIEKMKRIMGGNAP